MTFNIDCSECLVNGSIFFKNPGHASHRLIELVLLRQLQILRQLAKSQDAECSYLKGKLIIFKQRSYFFFVDMNFNNIRMKGCFIK